MLRQTIMSLIKWEPLNEIENLFGRALNWPITRTQPLLGVSDWNPRVDISESDGTYLIKADIPGVAKDAIKITMDNGMLTIQGERKQEKEEENKRFHRIERFYGSFTRSFSLPEDADPSAIKAAAEDGQLTVTIPRKEVAATTTAVQVPVE
jgi:HSP20 family protein